VSVWVVDGTRVNVTLVPGVGRVIAVAWCAAVAGLVAGLVSLRVGEAG